MEFFLKNILNNLFSVTVQFTVSGRRNTRSLPEQPQKIGVGGEAAFVPDLRHGKLRRGKQGFRIIRFQSVQIGGIGDPHLFVKDGAEVAGVVVGDIGKLFHSGIFPKMHL